VTSKFLYTLITPEGVEVLVGAFADDATATRTADDASDAGAPS
jgi:hypothetical protein